MILKFFLIWKSFYDLSIDDGNLKWMDLFCYIWNEKVLIWDKVWLLRKDQKLENSVSWWAKAAGTIPYEILVHLDRGIRREIVE